MSMASFARRKRRRGPITVPDRDVLIGLNGDAQRVSDPVSHSKFAANNNMPLVYGIEGLIDEVMIYDRALTAEEIRKSFQEFCPPAGELARPDLERRILPGEVDGSPAEKFGATCRTLKFHELWDNLWRPGTYRDIVVRFDTVPGSVVFWQGTSFGSGWVTENNKWMSDQSWEIGGPHGCAEHMADKRGRFDHVRLIENTDARVVVHWRYASIDVGYVFPGTDVWADEYYTIYPDGVGVRFVDVPDGGLAGHAVSVPAGHDLPGQHRADGPERGEPGRRKPGSDLGAAQPCARQSAQGRVHQADQLQIQVQGLRNLQGRSADQPMGRAASSPSTRPIPSPGRGTTGPWGLTPRTAATPCRRPRHARGPGRGGRRPVHPSSTASPTSRWRAS